MKVGLYFPPVSERYNRSDAELFSTLQQLPTLLQVLLRRFSVVSGEKTFRAARQGARPHEIENPAGLHAGHGFSSGCKRAPHVQAIERASGFVVERHREQGEHI